MSLLAGVALFVFPMVLLALIAAASFGLDAAVRVFVASSTAWRGDRAPLSRSAWLAPVRPAPALA